MTLPAGTRARVGQRHAKPAPNADPLGSFASEKGRETSLAAAHLSERLTALTNYLEAALRLSKADAAVMLIGPRHAEILQKAVAQVDLANAGVKRLRSLLGEGGIESRSAPKAPEHEGKPCGAAIKSGPIYRIRFFNELPTYRSTVKACQRTILIRSARSRERAVEAAKKRFARLEGIRDWRTHAQIVEVDEIEAV